MRTQYLLSLLCAFLVMTLFSRLAGAAEPATGAQFANFALVIGNNAAPADSAQSDLGVLRYADDDAARYYQFFRGMNAQVELLTILDSESQHRYHNLVPLAQVPNMDNLQRAVSRLSHAMQKAREQHLKPIFYFVFSGHGAVNAENIAYLTLIDGQLGRTQLIKDVLERVPADYSHVLIDACHAEEIVGVRGVFGTESDAHSTSVSQDESLQLLQSQSLTHLPGVGVIVATSVNAEAFEWSQVQSGVFTHELLSGLSGSADVNEDGRVEYGEIQAFIAAANRDINDLRAIPRIIAMPPRRNLKTPLVSLADFHDSAFLQGDPSQLGHFYIETSNGQRLLDSNLNAFKNVRLALPKGETLYLRTKHNEAKFSTAQHTEIAFVDLQFHPRPLQGRGSIQADLGRALFASSYNLNYYEGFLDNQRLGQKQMLATPTTKPQSKPSSTENLAPQIFMVSSMVVTGIATIAAGSFAVLATLSYIDYQQTELQYSAQQANERYALSSTAALGSALLAVLTGSMGLGAWLLWSDQSE